MWKSFRILGLNLCHMGHIGAISKLYLSSVLALILGGCASQPSQDETHLLDYRSRAQTQSEDGVRVSTSVLSANESLGVYGVPLAEHGVQPVWIEVENNDDATYWLLFPGLDPDFFLPTEVAERFATADEARALEQQFLASAFHNPVSPGNRVSGFVLTNLDEGVKIVQVDLLASGRLRTFSFLNEVPGFRADYLGRFAAFLDKVPAFRTDYIARQKLLDELYPPEKLINYTDDNEFRRALERLPCCVTNKKGTRNGDPLNLVVVGGREDAFPALVHRGWQPTEETWSGSIIKMVNSALSGERYRYAPISPLYLFGRPQDLALQRARDNIHQRNHLRLWLSPMRYQGKPVWVGQISRDIGSRLTIHSPYLVTHKIDPNVDEARTALMEDMAYSQNLAVVGLVTGVGAATQANPRRNLTTDPYYTDGFRAVLVFDDHQRALDEIDFFTWNSRKGGFIEQFEDGGRR